jgi:hypothetical protein
MKRIFLILTLMLQLKVFGKEYPIISILTCSPGKELYTAFGHTAIRVQDSVDGKWSDQVYNYGTFQFSDDFYYKFVQGHLDYYLSVTDFSEFQYNYLIEGRGINEQFLLIPLQDKLELKGALEENAKKSNRVFRYHFFKDNCSVRVWKIILGALSEYKLSISCQANGTFRQSIRPYLKLHSWGHFGIDLALGEPCDEKMSLEDMAFLPDSLEKLLSNTTYNDRPLVSPVTELIPVDENKIEIISVTPFKLCWIWFFLVLSIGTWIGSRGKLRTILDSFSILVYGVLGCFIVFLWFFTDHDTAHQNWNLLWANPIWLITMFFPPRRCGTWLRRIYYLLGFLSLISLLGFCCLPQELNSGFLPLILVQLYLVTKAVKPFWFTKKLQE